jgi:hypothetical protein
MRACRETRALQSALRQELEKLGIETEHLDGLVHDCASEINNCGMSVQVAYLLRRGWTPADIIGRAKMALEDTVDLSELTPRQLG